MARLSPITLGLSVLMVGIVSAGIVLMASRHQAGQPGAIAELTEQPATPPLTAVAPPPRAAATPPTSTTSTSRPALPAAEPDPIRAVESTLPTLPSDAATSAADASPPGEAAPNRRAALISNHNRRLGEADEQAFETLHLADSTRASIRQINAEYRRKAEPDSQAPGGGDVVEIAAALRTRQDALRLLLGETPAKEFDVEERAAVRRLRGKYRFEWGRQLRQ